jgi:hypothetical protein
MTKKAKYVRPAMQVFEAEMEQDLMTYSVQSTGLGDNDNLILDESSGDSWDDAQSRGGLWDE